tara:strand:- start:56 stop:202 length:147 start_codon:yes stop_codon:yes gene_type:complete
MSFGGGSAGSTGVTNHIHDNNTGEGGSLSVPQTLISDMPLSNYILVMG